MFGFKKKTLPSTLFIANTDSITDGRQTVRSVWQQRHAPSNIGIMLAKSICTQPDSLDLALTDYIQVHTLSTPLHAPYHSIVFDENSGGISGNVWHHGADYQVTVKGNPERILELCNLSENERESLTLQLHSMSTTGDDIIALAEGLVSHAIKKITELKSSERLTFVGFISLDMTVSSEARQLITMTKTHAMHLYLCTGKHLAASYTLAEQLDIIQSPSDVCDARTIDIAHSNSMSELLSSKTVFSHCSSQHKKQILSAIKSMDASVRIIATSDDVKKLLAK